MSMRRLVVQAVVDMDMDWLEKYTSLEVKMTPVKKQQLRVLFATALRMAAIDDNLKGML